ncbi:MAG TPA: ABC transporter permease [Acidobacteriota bacterium]|nr:ABC transporter permease [Acidobacteriota bacterium]
MKAILFMAFKDLRLLVRDRAAFFFTFFFPILYAVFFGMIFSGGGGDGSSAISVWMVDEDGSAASQVFVQMLSDAEELDVQTAAGLEEARESVRRGGKVAYIRLPKGFGQAQQTIFMGQPPKVEVGVDPSRQAESGMLQGLLMKYGAQSMQQILQDPGFADGQLEAVRQNTQDAPPQVRMQLEAFFGEMKKVLALQPAASQPGAASGSEDQAPAGFPQGASFQPLEVTTADVVRERRGGPTNAYSISFPQGIIWGILGCASGFAISLVMERRRGTLMRLRSGPLSRFQVLAGKALACFTTILGVALTLLLLARFIFGVHLRPGLLAMALFSIGLCFVGIMMGLSTLGRSEQATGGIGWAIMIVMAMLGGGMIPLFLMPSWMQSVSHISPVKWAILAMEGALWRGFTPQDMLLPCAILTAIGAAFFTLGIFTFKEA